MGADRELEADVFEELDPEHQAEFLHNRSNSDAARVLSGMAPDDAADLIMEIDQERRLRFPYQYDPTVYLFADQSRQCGMNAGQFIDVGAVRPVGGI